MSNLKFRIISEEKCQQIFDNGDLTLVQGEEYEELYEEGVGYYLTPEFQDACINRILEVIDIEANDIFEGEALDTMADLYGNSTKLLSDKYLELFKENEKQLDFGYVSIRQNIDALEYLIFSGINYLEIHSLWVDKLSTDSILELRIFNKLVLQETLFKKFEYLRDRLLELEDNFKDIDPIKAKTAGQKVLLLEELGVLELLFNRYGLDISKNKLGMLLSPLLEEDPSNIKSLLLAMYQPMGGKNNPNTEANKVWLTNLMTTLKLPMKKE